MLTAKSLLRSLSFLIILALGLTALAQKEPDRAIERTRLLINSHLHNVGSYLYGESYRIEYHLQRKLGSRTRLSQEQIATQTANMSELDLKDLELEAYESALERALRGVQILADVSMNLKENSDGERALKKEMVAFTGPESWAASGNRKYSDEEEEEESFRTVIESFNSFEAFKRYPEMQTDLERVLEFEGAIGHLEPEVLKASLEEIHREHHPESCASLLRRGGAHKRIRKVDFK